MHPIASLDDSRLDPYRRLKESNLTRWSGQFIAEGKLVVERLLESDLEVDSVLVSQRRSDLAAEFARRAPVLIVPQALAETLLGYNFHAGVLACARRPRPRELAELVPPNKPRMMLVACPRITGPDNLGTIVRLCAAFAVDGLLLGAGSADPWSRRSVRVAMGHTFRLPIFECADLAGLLSRLRHDERFDLAAADVDATAEDLAEAARHPRQVLVLGNEADGLADAWLELCDRRLQIPMPPSVDSLNVATAAAIFLYHLSRATR